MSDSQAQTQTPAKRASCDRCRGQKLRCIRENQTDACVRCNRSQHKCVTSSSRRPGRPKNSTTTRSQQDLIPSLMVDPGDQPPLDQPPVDQPPMDQSPLDIHLLTNIEDWFNFEMLGTNEDILSDSWNSVDADFPMDGLQTSPPNSPDRTTTNMSLDSLTTGTSLAQDSSSLEFEQGDNRMLQQYLNYHPSAPILDHGVQLSSLHSDLSKQLFTLKSMSVDMTKAMRLTCTHDAKNGDFLRCSQVDFETNPLAEIATTSAHFANLLCSFQMPTTCDGNNTSKDASAHNLSIADLLTILSCHMLTISIYDYIFSHFTNQTVHNPNNEVNNFMETAPNIFLGGIAVPPRMDMLSHFLYWLVESQLRPIEQLLSLPDEYCISSKKDIVGNDKSTRLFNGQRGQLLFSTLMKIETERASEGGGYLGAIHSLQEKIKHVQGKE